MIAPPCASVLGGKRTEIDGAIFRVRSRTIWRGKKMTDKGDKDKGPEETGFRVSDRRHFTVEGDLRDSGESEEGRAQQAAPKEPPVGDSPRTETQEARGTRPESGAQREPVDFASFILSLATTAMVHLGEIPDPANGQRSGDVEAARQMIEIITMLRDKTQGNLGPEESRLLESLLYELRMKFLAKAKAVKL